MINLAIRPLQFNTYLSQNGVVEKNPLIHFRGNRFNVVFANGARVFYLHRHIVNFLTNSLGTPNRLLKAVLDDASCKLYVAGCKALGLIDKHIRFTGPLWRILESNVHILDLPHYYNQEHMSRPKGGEGASDCVSDVLGEVH